MFLFQRFRVFLKERKYKDAVADLTTALEIDPKYKQVRKLLEMDFSHLLKGTWYWTGFAPSREGAEDDGSVRGGTCRLHPVAQVCKESLTMTIVTPPALCSH